MMNLYLIACEDCLSNIVVRHTPFSDINEDYLFECRECLSQIFADYDGKQLIFNNANQVDQDNVLENDKDHMKVLEECQFVDISLEFSSNNESFGDRKFHWCNYAQVMGTENLLDARSSSIKFLNSSKQRSDLNRCAKLYLKNKYKILTRVANKISKERIFTYKGENPTHYYYDVIYRIYEDSLDSFEDTKKNALAWDSDVIFNYVKYLALNEGDSFDAFYEYWGDQYFHDSFFSIIDIFNKVHENARYIAPSFFWPSLKCAKENRVLLNFDFEKLKLMYLECNELHSRALNLIACLKNISERKCYKDFGEDIINQKNPIELNSFVGYDIAKKTGIVGNFITDIEIDTIENQIRNSIGHKKNIVKADTYSIRIQKGLDPRSSKYEHILFTEFLFYLKRRVGQLRNDFSIIFFVDYLYKSKKMAKEAANQIAQESFQNRTL